MELNIGISWFLNFNYVSSHLETYIIMSGDLSEFATSDIAIFKLQWKPSSCVVWLRAEPVKGLSWWLTWSNLSFGILSTVCFIHLIWTPKPDKVRIYNSYLNDGTLRCMSKRSRSTLNWAQISGLTHFGLDMDGIVCLFLIIQWVEQDDRCATISECFQSKQTLQNKKIQSLRYYEFKRLDWA